MQACNLRGLRIADASAVMPVDYTRLVLAAAVGFVLFGEVPTAIVMLGAAIVVGSTLMILQREQKRHRPVSPATAGTGGLQ
jgi:drug/metabolite transporter (DMT)-like permease